MTRFVKLHSILTGKPVEPPTERERLLAEVAALRAGHRKHKLTLERLQAITHAELADAVWP